VCTTREWNGVIIAVSQYGPGDEALQLRDFYTSQVAYPVCIFVQLRPAVWNRRTFESHETN
jgi:hypothetical protein